MRTKGDPRIQLLERAKARFELDPEALARLADPSRGIHDELPLTASDFDDLRDRALAFIESGQAERGRDILEMSIVLGDGSPRTPLALSFCFQLLGDRGRAELYWRVGLVAAKDAGDDALHALAERWGTDTFSEAT